MKIWRPSYCRCVIEEVYDGTTIVGGGQVVTKCADHQGVIDADLYDVLLNAESRPAMAIYRGLLARSDTGETKTDAEGNTYRNLKAGVTVTFTYTGTGANRPLTVTITGTSINKAQIRTMIAELNLGKTVVVV